MTPPTRRSAPGLEAAELVGHPKVRLLDLAFVELQRPAAVLMEEWGALGLIVVGPDDGTPPVLRNLTRPQSAARRARHRRGRRSGAPRRGPPRGASVSVRRLPAMSRVRTSRDALVRGCSRTCACSRT